MEKISTIKLKPRWRELVARAYDIKSLQLTTWVFEDFVPTAKLVNGKAYSIISDHLGTPILAVDSEGREVWNRQLDIYGRVRKEYKHSSLGDDVFPFISW